MNPQRRQFLKIAGTGVAAALAGNHARASEKSAGRERPAPSSGNVVGLACPPLDVVRWGLIGTGNRGMRHLQELLRLEGCDVRAICDIDPVALDKARKAIAAAGRPPAAEYGDGPEAYRKLVERDDVNAVMICTPWRLHVPMAVAALHAGKHAFIEVPAAITMDECWQLVETAEKTRLHCMMLENCCYGRDELMVLNLCRKGMFGELLHGEGSYLHDLRQNMQHPDRNEGKWRPLEETMRNGNLYPTHGLGPVAQYMGINRGDRFVRLVSMSSPSRGLEEYAREHLKDDNPLKHKKFVCGDMNTSIIQTAVGRTIVVRHDTSNARPYSRTNMIQGTRGIFAGYPSRIAIEGRGEGTHKWDTDLDQWYKEFDHPTWRMLPELAGKGTKAGDLGHGGMDLLMKWRIVKCLRGGMPLDQDVYDAAAWSAVGPASEDSVARNAAPVEIPDFTRGAWKTTEPLGVVT